MESSKLVLITGHKGFIGQRLHSLIPHAEGFDIEENNDICGPLPDKPYTHIFHLAAMKSIPKGQLYPEDFVRVNCWGTLNLILKYPNARIINVSSSSANNVRSVYGATKSFSELAGSLHENCLNVRLYNVFGEGQPFSSGAAFPSFMLAKLTKTPPILYDHGRQRRDFTYVGDVVENLVDLMFNSAKTGLTHLGYRRSISVKSLLGMIYESGSVLYENRPKREFEINFSASPNTMRIIKYGRQDGIYQTIKWYQDEFTSGRIHAPGPQTKA